MGHLMESSETSKKGILQALNTYGDIPTTAGLPRHHRRRRHGIDVLPTEGNGAGAVEAHAPGW
jgi:hypothetical protein